MRTEAERQVRIRVAGHVERERIVEHLLVTVDRDVREQDLVARRDRDASNLGVLQQRAVHVHQRRDPTQALLHQSGEVVEPVTGERQLVGVRQQRVHPAGDHVAGRLVAADEQ